MMDHEEESNVDVDKSLTIADNQSESGEIALCLSGGGYRAAAFHLGVMKTLEKLKVLEPVKYVSTASGGTIAAMKWAISRTIGQTFDDYYEEMKKFLLEVNVVDEGLKIIEKSPNPDPSINDLSLIRSAANVYRKKLTGKRTREGSEEAEWTLQHLLDGMRDKDTFRDLVFNSSEFRTGNNFRFRIENSEKNPIFGNKYTEIKDEIATQLQLSDIVAASSCFPGVFEPMRFPDDFQFRNRSEVRKPFKTNLLKINSVSLMDGGILDNQGLYGMTVSYKKLPIPFELMIVSDTSGHDEEIYRLRLPRRVKGPSMFITVIATFLVLTILLICSILVSWQTITNPNGYLSTGASLVLGIFALLFSMGGLIGLIWGILKLRSLTVMGYSFSIWDRIKGLNPCDLIILGKSRFSSAAAMVFSVFMKRIRSQQINITENATDPESKVGLFDQKTVYAFVYTVIPIKGLPNKIRLPDSLKPTTRMIKIAEDASEVGTKLWVNASEFQALVDCGRFTICGALLDHFWNEEPTSSFPKPDIEDSPYHNIYQEWVRLREEFPNRRSDDRLEKRVLPLANLT